MKNHYTEFMNLTNHVYGYATNMSTKISEIENSFVHENISLHKIIKGMVMLHKAEHDNIITNIEKTKNILNKHYTSLNQQIGDLKQDMFENSKTIEVLEAQQIEDRQFSDEINKTNNLFRIKTSKIVNSLNESIKNAEQFHNNTQSKNIHEFNNLKDIINDNSKRSNESLIHLKISLNKTLQNTKISFQKDITNIKKIANNNNRNNPEITKLQEDIENIKSQLSSIYGSYKKGFFKVMT